MVYKRTCFMVWLGIIELVDSICRDTVDTQYMTTRLRNIKNVTKIVEQQKSKETR